MFSKKNSVLSTLNSNSKKAETEGLKEEANTLDRIAEIVKQHQINFFMNTNDSQRTNGKKSKEKLIALLQQMEKDLVALRSKQRKERENIFNKVKIRYYIL